MCEYCKNYFRKIEDLKPGDILITQKARYLQIGSNKGAEGVPMNFCPNCGERFLNASSDIASFLSDSSVVEDICCRIKNYDLSRPKMDELKFISDIMNDYSISRDNAVKLIQHVRRMFLAGKEQ